MFAGVKEKLERASHCLNNLKTLASDAKAFASIPKDKQQEMRANLDCFFFEIISAKDFFLQGMNDKYGAGLPKDQATQIDNLKQHLPDKNALRVVTSIEKLLATKNSWLWRLNNYRNSATHRELIHFGHVVEAPPVTVKEELFKEGRGLVIKLIPKGQEERIPSHIKRVDVPSENIKTYLFKDPEDPSQGNADKEVIPYCEQSLTRMKELLEKLYSELGLE